MRQMQLCSLIHSLYDKTVTKIKPCGKKIEIQNVFAEYIADLEGLRGTKTKMNNSYDNGSHPGVAKDSQG